MNQRPTLPPLDPSLYNDIEVISILRGNLHLLTNNLNDLAFAEGIDTSKLELMNKMNGALQREQGVSPHSFTLIEIMQLGLRYMLEVQKGLAGSIETLDAYSKHESEYQKQLMEVRVKQKHKIAVLKERKKLHQRQVKLYEKRARQLMDDPGLVLLPGTEDQEGNLKFEGTRVIRKIDSEDHLMSQNEEEAKYQEEEVQIRRIRY